VPDQPIQQPQQTEMEMTENARTELRVGDHPVVEVDWPDRGVAVMRLLGEHDFSNASDVGATIQSVLAAASRLVVDLSEAEFIDSTIIRMLLNASRQAAEDGVEFTLVADTNSIARRVLDLLKLLETMHVVDSVEDALPNARKPREQSRPRTSHPQSRRAHT
jgi:anti-anti-sigma factor